MATYRAIHDYSTKVQNQLSFKKGELFTLLSECGNGWLTVKKGAATGLVPANYLELVADKVMNSHYIVEAIQIYIRIYIHVCIYM